MSRRSPARARAPLTERKVNRPMRIAACVYGLLFLVIGVLGFVPGVTVDANEMAMAGHHSPALLFGLFQVSLLHNMVHLALGTAGIIAAGVSRPAAQFLLWGGVFYAALWLYGIAIPRDGDWNFLPVNTADNWLHLGLAGTMIALRFALSGRGPLPDAPLDHEENVWAHAGEGVPHYQVGAVDEISRRKVEQLAAAGECAVCRSPLQGEPGIPELHEGRAYHVCSAWCREQFRRVPERFVGNWTGRSLREPTDYRGGSNDLMGW